ncbi:MAG: 4Fe-4S binding protein [Clostridia bacterium]|nr:4Fe-4S binding protein [Clostridia bacterium]
MKKFFAKLKSLIPTKRRLIQLYAALLTNANVKGFINGSIYQGATKNACVPGLNCYSCPGAVGACPLGSLQNALAASGKRTPYYVFGIIILYGIILGRTICGFLCPFGLIQDLLYKIKTPKLGKSRVTKVLSLLKYVLLVLLVVVFPLIYALRDVPLPAFCKYICPAGTLGGAISLLSNSVNDGLFAMLGPLFTWKFVLLVIIVVACIFIYRAFCRFLCPLGALYGIFNKISVLGIKLDRPKCIDCGKCIGTCKMDITSVGDRECISCGDCVSVCPTQAISYRGSKIILPENEIPSGASEEEVAAIEKKRTKRVKIVKIVAAVLAVFILAGALVYFNFIDAKPLPDVGSDVGYSCPTDDLALVPDSGSVNIEDYKGRIVVINFWGTWCTPCVAELPHFDELAEAYADEVTVIAVHSSNSFGNMPADEYVEAYYKDSKILFAMDTPSEDNAYVDAYYSALGGTSTYPMTLILDRDGVISFKREGSMTYADLEAAIAEIK